MIVKDSKGRFPKKPSRGDGWDLALIKTDDTQKNVSANYKKDCQDYHVPTKSTDWIYVEGMPTLSHAK